MITYSKLWRLLSGRGFDKRILASAGLAPDVIESLERNEHVSTETLALICDTLGCGIGDIADIGHSALNGTEKRAPAGCCGHHAARDGGARANFKSNWIAAYDTIGVSLYIIDLDTYDIVYQNKASYDLLGDIIGKKCYNAVRGLSSICEDCFRPEQLEKSDDHYLRKTGYSAAIDKYFTAYECLVDWDDGKKARLCVLVDVTEETMLKEQNRKKDELLAMHSCFIDSANTMMGALSRDGKVLFANKSFASTLGYDDSFLKTFQLQDFHTEKALAVIREQCLPALNEGKTWKGESEARAKDGTVIPLRQTAFPVRNEDGEIIAFATTFENISEEKKMEEMFRWQLAIIESSKDYISVANLDKEVIYNSPGAYRMMGYKMPEHGDRMPIETVHSEQYGRLVREVGFPAAIATGNWTGRGDLTRRDGKILPIEQSIFPVYDKRSEIMGVATIIRDISGTVASEQVLEKQLKLQQILAEFSINFTSDKDFDLIINDSLKLLAGFLKTDELSLFIDERENSRVVCKYESVDDPEESNLGMAVPYADEFGSLQKMPYVFFKDASAVPEYLNIAARGNASLLLVPVLIEGESLGILVATTHNEEAEWTENEFNLTMVAAGILGGAFARDAGEKKLVETTRRAEEASRAKSEFLSRMSHEIRTPMNAIIGMTRIGMSSSDESRMQYCLGKINTASRHLLGLINDILDMSKIESGKLELINEPFNIERMLENICNVIQVKAEEKKISLFVDIADDVPVNVIGDELRLSQVITNLLSNAVKFTPDFGTIHLNMCLDLGGGQDESAIYCEVVDSGIGISDDQVSKLFQSFEQADANISRKFGGTGLGLAISKNIIEMMGGTVSVSSQPGVGSRFYFSVKLKHAGIDDRRGYDKAIYKDFRALIVDDEQRTLDYFDRVITEIGMSFDLALNGQDAVEMAEHAAETGLHYDIIFVDYMMEGMDGIETARRIRKILGDGASIVMISVSDWEVIEKDAVAVGVNRFVQKPLFRSSIFDTVNEMLIKKNSIRFDGLENERGLSNYSGCNMMLVEDIDINREIVVTLLEETGLSIDCAADGREAVKMFGESSGKYDIIFMDIQMPIMDGLEATRQIRALGAPDSASVPIVAMTANVFKEDVELCKAAGMVDHIGKPIDVDELMSKLAKYLSGKRK